MALILFVPFRPLVEGWPLPLPVLFAFPLCVGFVYLRLGTPLSKTWRRLISAALLVLLSQLYLSPFLLWWKKMPYMSYFMWNVLVLWFISLLFLVLLNQLVIHWARWLGDTGLAREARGGQVMVVLLNLGFVGALMYLSARVGFQWYNINEWLGHLFNMPGDNRFMLLLPQAMTVYILWRAKEAGDAFIRRCVVS